MEAVQDEAESRMIGTLDDGPGIAMIVDVCAPSERLIADAQTTYRRPLGKFPQIVDNPLVFPRRLGDRGRTDHQKVGPQFGQKVEFSFGPVERPFPLFTRQSLEIPKWLKGHTA